MLENFVFPPLEYCQSAIIIQNDGVSPQWGLELRDALHRQFSDRWIAREGPTPWLERSSDLTPLNFFLRICEKSGVCYTS